jgi:uncharacterized membrane protein YeaQ/YmgE (transglycosylase-associated protein family)
MKPLPTLAALCAVGCVSYLIGSAAIVTGAAALFSLPRCPELPMVSRSRGAPMNVIWFLVVGVIAGWLAGLLVKGAGFGLIGDLVVGILGALIGGMLIGGSLFGGGLIGSIIVATIGAVLLLVVLRVLKRA